MARGMGADEGRGAIDGAQRTVHRGPVAGVCAGVQTRPHVPWSVLAMAGD